MSNDLEDNQFNDKSSEEISEELETFIDELIQMQEMANEMRSISMIFNHFFAINWCLSLS